MNSSIISKECEKEVFEYIDRSKPIIKTDEPFPKNHLFCKRTKNCEFVEYQKIVYVYEYPIK